MPTERKRAIRTAAAWAANQAEMEALYGVGGYYTSLSLWEAGEQGNLVTADEIRTAVCYNDWPGAGLEEPAGLNISGSTTDSTRYLKVTVAPGNRHNGIHGTGFRLWRYNAVPVTIRSDNVLMEWIEAQETVDGNGFRYAFDVVGAVTLFACLGISSFEVFLCRSGALSKTCRVICCLVPDTGRTNKPDTAFTTASGGFSRTEFLNCVGYANDAAPVFRGNSNTTERVDAVRNCIAIVGGAGAAFSGFDPVASSNNAATNGGSVTPLGASPYSSNVTPADFVDFANANYHLVAASGLRGAGANLYSTFTQDIDGDTWPSAGPWSIGIDHYVAAGPSAPTLSSLTTTNVTQSGARHSLTLTF